MFPSANEALARMGVEFRKVQGRYKAGTNPIEAKAIVDAIFEFMRNDPNRSLGVVTLRDRLRQEILEKLGWKLHRIWSTDWFNNPRQEAERLRGVIATRMAELKARAHEFAQPAQPTSPPARHPESQPIVIDMSESAPPQMPLARQATATASGTNRVEIGDTVRVRYLNDDKRTVHITISNIESDLGRGVVYHTTPLAAALLGAERGEEVEVLVGSYIRPAIIESIAKGTGGQPPSAPG